MCVCTCPRHPAASSRYDTSLTEGQWAQIEPLLPVANPRHGGRQLKYDRRLILDTVLYVLRTGRAWRLVPHDLAPWDAAYRWFRAWTADGTWRQVHEALRDRVRERDGRDGRDAQPTAAVLDSQSATSAEGGEAIGYDAGKRVRGRKRHLLVDTNGLLLRRVVTQPACRTGPAPSWCSPARTSSSPSWPGLGRRWLHQQRRRATDHLGRPAGGSPSTL